MKIVAAIDIGTQMARALVGEIYDLGKLNIIGRAEVPSNGVVKGVIRDFRAASDTIRLLIDEAEAVAGVAVDQAYTAISGPHLEGFTRTAVTQVRSPDNIVSADDVARVVDDGKGKQLPSDRIYINHIRNGFSLDSRPMDDPMGAVGNSLEVTYWSVHGSHSLVADYVHVVNSRQVSVADIVVAGVASAYMVAREEERKTGCLVLDIGKGTTDYAFYRAGSIVRTGVVPVGGEHVTNDISIGLRINTRRAEELKRDAASAVVESSHSGQSLHLYGDMSIGDRMIYLSSLNTIVEARMEELFSIILDELGGSSALVGGAASVVLTGGGSRLRELPALAERVFSLPARAAENPEWVAEELRAPEYSTVLGVLHYALSGDNEMVRPSEHGRRGGLARKMSRLFRG